MVVQRRVGRVVADAEHLRKPDGDEADQKTAHHGPRHERHIEIAATQSTESTASWNAIATAAATMPSGTKAGTPR